MQSTSNYRWRISARNKTTSFTVHYIDMLQNIPFKSVAGQLRDELPVRPTFKVTGLIW